MILEMADSRGGQLLFFIAYTKASNSTTRAFSRQFLSNSLDHYFSPSDVYFLDCQKKKKKNKKNKKKTEVTVTYLN